VRRSRAVHCLTGPTGSFADQTYEVLISMRKVCCFHRFDRLESAVFSSQFSNPEQQLRFKHF
jgi:hypothetical protein